jgi:hypothetical protein
MVSSRLSRPLLVAGLLVVAATSHADIDPIDIGGIGKADARFGAALAPAGDFNGDGLEDLVVGAPGYSGALPGQGAVYLVLGRDDGGFGEPKLLGEGQRPDGGLGWSVTGRCDFNGDGYPDVAAGAPAGASASENMTSPRVYVYFGGNDGGAQPVIISQDPGSAFGASLACLHNLSGDGGAWLLVGAPRYPGKEDMPKVGAVFLYTFKSDGGTENHLVLQGQQDGEGCGAGVTALPPDSNGVARVVVGCPRYAGGTAVTGRLRSLGFRDGAFSPQIFSLPGPSGADSDFGSHVDAIGDFDGDGLPDIAVAAPRARDGGGEVRIVTVVDMDSTSAGLRLKDGGIFVNGAVGLGRSLARAGDVNGDGFADLVVGVQFVAAGDGSRVEAAIVLHGGGSYRPPPELLRGSMSGLASFEDFGAAVAGIGDVDGDGFADLAVGAPQRSAKTTPTGPEIPGAGGVSFFSGRARGPSRSAGTIILHQTSSMLPGAIAGAGDVNGDGFDDLLLGRPGASDGCVAVLYGPFKPDAGNEETRLEPTCGVGASVASAGDVNGDGYADVIVGAPWEDGGKGSARVYLGSKDGIGITAAWQATTTETGARFGAAVAGAGDVDGDGYDDVVVGAPGAGSDGGLHSPGAVYVFRGGPNGLEQAPAWSLVGEANERLGASVAGAGDFNGDGCADFVAGSPGAYNNDSVRVFGVICGSPSTGRLELKILGRLTDDLRQGLVGARVSGARDVDGDGLSDVVLSVQPMGSGPRLGVLFGVPRDGGMSQRSGLSPPLPVSTGAMPPAAVDVAGVGDVDGDGLGDVVLASKDFEGGAVLYLGHRLSGSTIMVEWDASWRPGDPAASLGTAVAAAGDLDRDGFNDFLVSVPREPEVRVFFGGDFIPGRPYNLEQWFGGERRGRGFAAPNGTIVTLAAELRDEVAGLAPLTLQVEVRPVGTRFTGEPTASSAPSAKPGRLQVQVGGLARGRYHWQARVVSNGRTGRWRAFGADDESATDFSIGLARAVPPDGGVASGDAGVDEGEPDAIAGLDGGTGPFVFDAVGCNCGTGASAPSVWLWLAFLLLRRSGPGRVARARKTKE